MIAHRRSARLKRKTKTSTNATTIFTATATSGDSVWPATLTGTIPPAFPAHFTFLRSNETYKKSFKVPDEICAEYGTSICSCSLRPGARCDDGSCQNFSAKDECVPGQCENDECSNRSFTKMNSLRAEQGTSFFRPGVAAYSTLKCGWGLKATTSFEANEMILEYTGAFSTV